VLSRMLKICNKKLVRIYQSKTIRKQEVLLKQIGRIYYVILLIYDVETLHATSPTEFFQKKVVAFRNFLGVQLDTRWTPDIFCKPIFDEKKQQNIFANPFSMRKNS